MKVTAFLALLPLVLAAPAPLERRADPVEKRAAPTVIAPSPQATVAGKSLLGVESFNGIPYAQPPVGQLRLKPPQPLISALGAINGAGTPKACPQMFFSVDESTFPSNTLGLLLNTPLFQTVTNQGEDCLTINVQRPAGTKANAKLPVLFWVFGGGFELGSTSMYDGASLVMESVAQGKPVIFVAVNYRVGGFGFMPGKEILADGSSNLGLLDQRLGLQWTADNIAAFGGDPEKVTIWGQSAGAISVLDQMILYDGDNTYKSKPLFRAAIMNSGSIAPTDPVDCPKGQAVYNKVVQEAGCASSSDTLACLRELPYAKFLDAANSVPGILSYSTVALSYLPRPDGKVMTSSPESLIAANKYAKVPFIVGDQEDEGTLFGLFTQNITTTAQLSTHLKTYYFNNASPALIDQLVATYPETMDEGSPFRTGIFNNISPQFKRFSALIGDAVFTLSRRVFLDLANNANPTVPSWSYLATYDYGTPVLGTFHGSDLLQTFFGILPNNAAKTTRGYYFSFVYNLDPNLGNNFQKWPRWSEARKLLSIGANSNGLMEDTFRQDSASMFVNNPSAFRI